MTTPLSNSTLPSAAHPARALQAALGTILLDWRANHPANPVLLHDKGLAIPPAVAKALQDLLEALGPDGAGPLALTVLSNAVPDLNPCAGLAANGTSDAPDNESGIESGIGSLIGDLVTLLGPGELHEWPDWPTHAVLLSAAAVEALARPDTTAANAPARLWAAGGRLLLADTVFLHDARRPLFHREALEPHEERQPPPWGSLVERLDGWLRNLDADTTEAGTDTAGDLQADLARLGAAPAAPTLHITHSWGGGVARWVEAFIEADRDGAHFQLRAEGPQSGKGCGQRLALYLGNRLETPVARWWLQPPIRSAVAEHAAYRHILDRVLSRYGIGRILVSSLVGHSLDALTTDRPTLQVLHDYFPRWPLLGVHPTPYLQPSLRQDNAIGGAVDLERAMGEHALLPEFRDHDAAGWLALGERWRETVQARQVRVVAPSRSVVELLRGLDPGWSATDIEVIPHGLPPLPGTAVVRPRERADGRLRIVVPGRIQEGKGQRLLLDALPELTRYARVCLLGAGKAGEAFFGRRDVDVIIQYRREDLRGLLAALGPHVAALLSIVPETFSFTLTEMQQLGIPVIATRVGSLAERIEDGVNGWLIEPDARALIERVRELAADHGRIEAVRERVMQAGGQLGTPGPEQMTQRYAALLPPAAGRPVYYRERDLSAVQLAALAFQARELAAENRRFAAQVPQLQQEIDRRTEWAEERERARQQEEELRVRWVTELERQLDERWAELQAARDAFEHEQAEHAQTREAVRNLEHMLQELQAVHDWVLASRSWRYTRAFRVGARMVSNLRRAGTLNPARWPLLLSQASRTIRTRGWRGALLRAQLEQTRRGPQAVDAAAVEAVGDPQAPERLPRAAQPDVSIVIPVYNKWVYTAACLRSLAETACRASFEVIVVDDRSSDETPERLSGIEGLVQLRNEENLGFVGSCNRGAEQATGRYVLMLNNDTQVLDGWLDALLDTFERHPRTGLAGARLVYPDGSLQEAGGIVFNDGSGWNYGRDDRAERPEYRYSRVVDYCSGACIMLPTELFRELGGFDPLYAPAYYEDTDLAFRVRARGFEVRLQPAATVIHHEGVSSGTDIGSGVKRYQAINREKFLERWRDELTGQPPPVVDPQDAAEIRRARDHRLKGRVLIVDAYTPEPDQDSGSLRLRYLMDCFAELGYGVTFLPDNRAHAGRYTLELQAAGVEAVYDPWIGSLQRFFSERGAEFDFVMISRHYVASRYLALLKRHCPQARFLFDTVDLHYLREERLAELEDSLPLKRSAAQTRRSELAVIEAADATLVVSPVEKAVLAKAAPGARVHVISNVHEVVGSRRPFAERKDIFFVGGYQHPPNIDAARWFVGSIWPLIRKELPGVEFHLIGSKAPEQVRALAGNGVRFQGFVEDLEPWLDGCRIAVAPLRYGAGIKGKVNISMSRGQPVVATPVAVEGMFAEAGRDVLVAETAEAFATEVVRLYRDEDLWNQVSTFGLENVQKYFSVETARLGLQQLLKALS